MPRITFANNVIDLNTAVGLGFEGFSGFSLRPVNERFNAMENVASL